MNPRTILYFSPATVVASLLIVATALLSSSPVKADGALAPSQQIIATVEVPANGDIGVTEVVPTASVSANPYFVLNSRPAGTFDHNFVYFDLTVLPANATIDSAELVLYFNTVANSIDIQTGVVEDVWEEATMNWNTQPPVDWSGPTHTVDADGEVRWPILSLIQQWMDGSVPNYGIAMRGQTVGTGLVQAQTRDGDPAPKLVLTYSQKEPDTTYPRPDLGDAPDSTNHHGQPNTAYLIPGTLGQFPTVYQVPANQAAGPLHRNETGEGILGQYISREREADDGPDQDGLNNIIRDATGTILDIANHDRGDDGWRNRNIRFFNCRERTLTVRVFKAPNATLNKMYLNVWFDGNRDGDWDDIAPCPDPNGGPADASYEWIVQDHIIDMTAISPGDYLDFSIPTELVHNSTPNLPHWMRFTLSEERAVQPPNGDYPDGRGPHPNSQQKAFKYGETEDILQRPPTGGQAGELVLEKRVLYDEEPVPYADSVTYQIRLRHEGGSQPIEAEIRDELPYPLHLNTQIDSDGNIFLIEASSATGGATPLEALLEYNHDDITGIVTQVILWEGTLDPDSEIVLSFEVHIHPICQQIDGVTVVQNIAHAREPGEARITAEATFDAACAGWTPSNMEVEQGGTLEPDPSNWTRFEWQGTILNKHQNDIAIGLVQETIPDRLNPDGDTSAASLAMLGESRFISRVELKAGEKKSVSLPLHMDELQDSKLNESDDAPLGKLRFCILPGDDNICPDPTEYPDWWGDIELPYIPRRADLGDAPDSTNHFTPTMTAYPGIQANFPTVFDPATGLPPGPRHLRPWLFHLGPDVSNEVEADIGFDVDGDNNIEPLNDTPNLDWYDDGAALTLQGQCQPALADVEINVSPRAKRYFTGTNSMAYLNVWLDWSYDGDWDDTFICTGPGGQSEGTAEHILIDYLIDVTTLVTGTNSITNIVTSRVPWPPQFNDMERWVRFTLSDIPSNKTLSYFDPSQDEEVKYGDGRGYLTPFKSGETEDYLWDLRDDAPTGPDLTVQVGGVIDLNPTLSDLLGVPSNSLRLRVNYANIGSQTADDAVLTLTLPETLGDAKILDVAGPGIEPDSWEAGVRVIKQKWPKIPPHAHGTVAVHVGPVLDIESAIAALASANESGLEITAEMSAAGDLNELNNKDSTTIAYPSAPLRLAGTVDGDDLLRKADTTCHSRVDFAGRGEPLAPAVLRVNDTAMQLGKLNAIGITTGTLTSELRRGKNLLWLDYANDPTRPGNVPRAQAIRLNVDPNLVIDPITLLLTDDQGRQHHPSTLNWSSGSFANFLLESGKNYDISFRSCGSEVDIDAHLMLGSERLTVLRDDDGDGLYTGRFTYRPEGASDDGHVTTAGVNNVNELRLVITANGVERKIHSEVEAMQSVTVVDAVTGLPIAGATVTALQNSHVANINDTNPQMTDANGGYSFNVAEGSYQLEVAADGYQPYRSQLIEVTSGVLAIDVHLSPAIDEPAEHTIFITPNGFAPANLVVEPDTVVAFINTDLSEHAIVHDKFETGWLRFMEAFKVRLIDEGIYVYTSDNATLLDSGTISVQQGMENPNGESPGGGEGGETPIGGETPLKPGTEVVLFLPLVQ